MLGKSLDGKGRWTIVLLSLWFQQSCKQCYIGIFFMKRLHTDDDDHLDGPWPSPTEYNDDKCPLVTQPIQSMQLLAHYIPHWMPRSLAWHQQLYEFRFPAIGVCPVIQQFTHCMLHAAVCTYDFSDLSYRPSNWYMFLKFEMLICSSRFPPQFAQDIHHQYS